MKYEDYKEQLDIIIGAFREKEEPMCKLRRELRRTEVDIEELRRSNKIDADETFVPQRIIDRRIKEELPNQIRVITQAQRLLVLKSKGKVSPLNMERAFTRAMRYPGWELPWIRLFDAVSLHGGAGIEVIFDPSMPGNCKLEYVRREDFIFPIETRNLNLCETVARRYTYPLYKFESFIRDYNFNKKAVEEVVGHDLSTPARRNDMKTIYKVYRRRADNKIEVFWYGEGASDFLRAPEVLSMGIMDFDALRAGMIASKPLTKFPIFWMPYEVIEDDRLLASKGRAFRDAPDQEALTQLWTSLINASIKASGIYGSQENTFNSSGVTLGETTKLEKNKILNTKVNYFALQFPTGEILTTALRYGVVSAATSGRIDVAAANRPDSRKTAREISQISDLQEQVASLGVLAQLSTVLDVYKLCFDIFRSSLVFGETELTKEEILEEYEVEHSGSFELLEREQRKSTIVNIFPYIGNTPLSTIVLQYLIEQLFPDKAKEWNAILSDNDPVVLLSTVAPILQSMMEIVPPDSKQQLSGILREISAYLQKRGANPVSPMAGAPNDTAPAQGAPQSAG